MLDDEIYLLARNRNFAVVTTRAADGSTQASMMWIDATERALLINTETGRAKDRHVQRDSSVTILIWDAENPYRYAEVRGRVVDRSVGEPARRHLDSLADKYLGTPYQEPVRRPRVLWTVNPERQFMRQPPPGGHGASERNDEQAT